MGNAPTARLHRSLGQRPRWRSRRDCKPEGLSHRLIARWRPTGLDRRKPAVKQPFRLRIRPVFPGALPQATVKPRPWRCVKWKQTFLSQNRNLVDKCLHETNKQQQISETRKPLLTPMHCFLKTSRSPPRKRLPLCRLQTGRRRTDALYPG